MDAVCKRLPELGVTSFCPTLRASSSDVYRRVLPRLKPATTKARCASSLGAVRPPPGGREVDCDVYFGAARQQVFQRGGVGGSGGGMEEAVKGP